MPRPAARFVSLAGFALAALVACGDRATPQPAPTVAPSSVAPVEEPAGLALTFQVRDGAAVWGAAKTLAADRTSLFPTSVGTVAAFVTGLPITTASLFSEHDPILGAALGPDLFGGPEAVIALHVRDADRLISLATQGQGSLFKVRRDPSTSGDLLDRISGEGPHVGLFGNHLVVGTSERALLALGPYVSRNLAASPGATADVEVHLLPSLLKVGVPLLRLRAHGLGGGAAESLLRLAADDALDRLGDAESGELTVSLAADGARISLVLKRRADAPDLPEVHGPVAALLALPVTTQVGVAVSGDSVKRKADAQGISNALSPYLEAADRASFDRAFGALTEARNDEVLFGFENGTLGPALYGRVGVHDRKAAGKALAGLVELANTPSVTASLAKQGLRVTAKETVLERVGDIVRVRIGAASESGAGGDAPPPKQEAKPGLVDLYVRDTSAGLTLGAGFDAETALHQMLDGPRLATDAATAALVARLPKEARVAIVVDPQRLTHGASRSRSRLVAAMGDSKSESRADLVLDAKAAGALIELALP